MAVVDASGALALIPPAQVQPGAPTDVKFPTVTLTGNDAHVTSCQFSPNGRNVATASADKLIRLYPSYGSEDTIAPIYALKGHQGAVLEIHWSADSERLYSCSADRCVAVWDPTKGTRIKKLSGHSEIVNSCYPARQVPNYLVSGGDDGTTRVWDLRVRRGVATFEHRYQILAVAFDESSHRVFAGSLDNKIRVYDLRKALSSSPPSETPEKSAASITDDDDEAMVSDSGVANAAVIMVMEGHADSITGLDVSPEGGMLLSNSMDSTVRLWDIAPFCPNGDDKRCRAVMRGPTHNFEKNLLRVRWNADSTACGVGSSDRNAYVFDLRGVESGLQQPKVLYKLPRHHGAVTEVCFHPIEKLVASSSSDGKVILSQLQ